ncbi:MAG: hypothetical protein RL115_1067 [Bacteroidota bacterium]|jgi:saccharopine dehydrogenase (NADP+, L-glutamate forming)
MKKILVFGAGKSATVLINYLLQQAANENWIIQVVDADLLLAKSKVAAHPAGQAISFDINDEAQRSKHVADAAIVISLLPPQLHILVAKECLKQSKNLLTASYLDGEIKQLENEVKAKGLLFLYEMGLDPGIDHMSAMQLIDKIKNEGGHITSFYSHCGGIVAPESDDNPWHYKISWNPRNIVMAGKAGAIFLENGQKKEIAYKDLFNEDQIVEIPNLSNYAWYANRDSLSYIDVYQLANIKTFVRTTLRPIDFVRGWKKLVALNFTAETPLYKSEGKSLGQMFTHHLAANNFNTGGSNKEKSVMTVADNSDALFLAQLKHLGLDDALTIIEKEMCSPADLLQAAMEQKLALLPTDKDMIVMLHEIAFEKNNKNHHIKSWLVVKGQDSLHTAMAKTVGLPLGIAAKNILSGKISLTGLKIPIEKEIYEPVLTELATYNISFQEK